MSEHLRIALRSLGAYQLVIDKYGLSHIDLDIESDDLVDVPGETERFGAIKLFKEQVRPRPERGHGRSR